MTKVRASWLNYEHIQKLMSKSKIKEASYPILLNLTYCYFKNKYLEDKDHKKKNLHISHSHIHTAKTLSEPESWVKGLSQCILCKGSDGVRAEMTECCNT